MTYRFACSPALPALLLLLPLAAPAQTVQPPESPPPAAATPIPAPSPEAPPAAPVVTLIDPLMSGRMGGMGGMMDPAVGHLLYRADLGFSYFPSEAVKGQNTHLGYGQQNLGVSSPIWQNDVNELSLSARVQTQFFDTGAVLPDTHQPFPDELWNVRLGTSYRHLFDNGWIGGVNIGIGSNSDKPFQTVNELSADVNGFVRIPQGEHCAWLFSLNLSTNSQVLGNIPIPGVAFAYFPSDSFHMTVGFPFADMTIRPIENLTLQFNYAILTNIHAKAIYRLGPHFRIYTGFDWSNENYFLVDRPDYRDRFFYFDKRASTGVQYIINEHIDVDLSGGYDFDRYFFEGQNQNDINSNRIDVGNGPFVAVKARFRY
jgi:hypothetical protein